MSVELLEREETEPRLSNRDNAKLSYNAAYLSDSQNIDERTLKAVKQYTSNADDINGYFRMQFNSAFLDNAKKDQEMCDNATHMEERCNALANYLDAGRLPTDFRLFRGTSLEDLCGSVVFGQIDSSIFLDDCRKIIDSVQLTEKYKGQIFTYKQPVSASIIVEVACDFLKGPTQCMLNISAPKGTCARCLGDSSTQPEEVEVLLASGMQFRIIKIESQSEMKDIYVEVAANPPVKTGYNVRNEY